MHRHAISILGFLIWVLSTAAPLAAEGDASAELASVEPHAAILSPRTPEVLASLRDGIRVWMFAVVDEQGGSAIELADVDTAAAALLSDEKPVVFGTDAPALAETLDVSFVVSTEVLYEQGEVTVWVRTFETQSGTPVKLGKAEGLLKDLGALLVKATKPHLSILRASTPPDLAIMPQLSELASYGRAWTSLGDGQFSLAWEALEGKETAAADWIRDRIVAESRGPEVSVAQRSRLASIRGTSDGDWLKVRHGLVKGNNAELLVAGADNAVARQDPERALDLYAKAVSIDPDNASARQGRARMQAAVGDHQAAKQSFEEILQADPENAEAHEALALNPVLSDASRAQHHLDAGAAHTQKFQVDQANQQFGLAGPLGPIEQARRNVALMNERLGNNGQALLEYEEMAAGGSRDASTQLGLARTRHKAGDITGANSAYIAAQIADPDNPEAFIGGGRTQLEQGDASGALAPLEQAVSLAPDDPAARRALAKAHQAAGNPDAALRALDPSSVAVEDRAGMLADAAAIHEAAGRPEEAQIALEQAVSLAPEDPPLRTSLARVYETNGDAEAAAAQELAVAALGGVELAPTDESLSSSALSSNDGSLVVSGAQFNGLVATFPVQHPRLPLPIETVVFLGIQQPTEWEYRVRQWLMPQLVDTAAIEAALIAALSAQYDVVPMGPVPELVQGPYQRVVELSTSRADLSLVNDLLGADATVIVHLEPVVEEAVSPVFGPADRPLRLKVRMNGGRVTEDVFILANAVSMPQPDVFVRWNKRAAVPLALLIALLAYPVVRGWGALEVDLAYELTKGSKGFFSIQLSKKPGVAKRDSAKGAKSKSMKYQRKVKRWSRYAKDMVGPKTTFRMIPARSYYVVVHGLLQDATSKEVIGNYLEERKIKVTRGDKTAVQFDFRVTKAPITIQLNRPEGSEDMQVLVAFKNQPESLRYVKDESVILFADNGRHTIVVGGGGSVYEVQVEIADYQGLQVPFGLGDAGQAVFSDCPDAVEPFVLGDFKAVSKALDRAGQTELANSIRAEYHHERGEDAEAAKFYEAAGNLTMAAELSAETAGADHSATLFEQAGDFRRAAEGYAEAGDLIKAAQAFETAYDYDNAIDSYRQAGQLEKTAELLEKVGRFFEAGAIALEQGDKPRGIRNLQMVDVRDPDYGEACRTLAELFGEQGEWGLAVDKAREAVSSAGDDHAGLEVHEYLGVLLEKAGRSDEALEVYEGIRKRDFTYEGIADRITNLREMASTRAAMEGAKTQAAGTVAPAPARPAADARYEILGELGRGGMGIVYKAKDTRLGRTVALKQLPDNLKDHPTAVQLFLREARAAAALNHQNIVTLFDADQTDDNYFITMEMLEGYPLDAVLEKRGALSAKDALRLAVQTATGLQYAHEQRIVHRDIKTSNLFFTRDRVVKIMDFGLAKMLEEVRRAATVIGGTPYYMAPEQAAGEDLDHRADLYAFGVTLFELLAGRVPFKEGDVTYHHRHTPPPDLREFAPDTPEDLVVLIEELMAKAPADRPATTAEVVTRLQALLKAMG